jgi:hypothetical protein
MKLRGSLSTCTPNVKLQHNFEGAKQPDIEQKYLDIAFRYF